MDERYVDDEIFDESAAALATHISLIEATEEVATDVDCCR